MEEEQKKGKKVWIDKNGIICFSTGKSPTEEDIEDAIDEAIEVLKRYKGQGKVLVNTSPYAFDLSGAKLRKKLANRVKKVFKEIGFKKIAIFGGDVMSRTITYFIITASGIKDMKVFKEKEEALKWLKKE